MPMVVIGLIGIGFLPTIDPSMKLLAAETQLAVEEDDRVIAVTRGGKVVLVYNKVSPPFPPQIDPVFQRSGFLHPVFSPRGKVVTDVFPADHPHQQGIFSAWVRTRWRDRKVDFWNVARGTGQVTHERVVSTFQDESKAGFKVQLILRALHPPKTDILRETWKVTVRPSEEDVHCFDLESTQENLTESPLIIDEYHYGGFAVRGPMSWLEPKDPGWTEELGSQSGSRFLNDLGSDRLAGNHQRARWVSMYSRDSNRMATITMLCHPSNRGAPQATRLHPTKPYFCFAACVDGEFTIEPDDPLRSRYRYLVTDKPPDPSWLNRQYESYAKE